MRRKCRIWWPKQLQLSSSKPLSSNFLFGWFLSSSSASLDIVVAFASSEVPSSHNLSDLEGILRETNVNMPQFLQENSTLCILGQHAVDLHSTGLLLSSGTTEDQRNSSTCGNACLLNNRGTFRQDYGRWTCGCHKLDGSLEQCTQASTGNCNWILLACYSHEQFGEEIYWIPKLHHIHWNGQVVFQSDIHVIFYETPSYGGHHFSLHLWDSSERVKAPLKKPKWVDELHQKQPVVDLDKVILAINSAAAAKIFFERHVAPGRSFAQFSILCMFITFMWQVIAISTASLSTLFYVILQLLHSLLSYGSQSWIYVTSAKIFGSTWIITRIRCCQILYWPIFLQETGLRSLSCVEYAEKAALHKHSIWSSIALDVLLGNFIGLALLYNAESACMWIMKFANDITNKLLRLGCVWLMGVPAGFKLNTELAGVLGMISLNAIQIWSTLWGFVGFLSIYIIKGLAISGILFGMTIPAALIIDILLLSTLHVSSLHWLLSLIYSTQIQALAALWRLFRGRKWNPLRQRLDSYDYTVKQHVVGSLLFPLLLLLLPTTSVFYIFFSIVNTTISLICILIEVIISVIYATPSIKIFLWLVRQRRFPSGIWFEIVSCQSNLIDSSSENLQRNQSGEKSSILVSLLHSNFLSVGELVLPHYVNIFSGVSGSFVVKSIHGVLTGKRVTYRLGTALPSRLPWMFIPYREYWYRCYYSILGCSRT
ncbi:hypothetical protein I3843_09G043600 [Carya illinoinensis]|nr:hypothetical protein I3843_09G043600 [Carya illinoinensis]KAG7962003.1 hypothetical protein I3843_09G043600 [Carya illinoinensis]